MKAAILSLILLFGAAIAQSDFAELVSASALTNISLPANALRVRDKNIPTEISQMLTKIIETDARFTQGEREVIVWTNKKFNHSNAAKIRAQVEGNFKNAGWDFHIAGEKEDITIFTAIKKTPTRRNISGFWTLANDALMLSIAEVFVKKISSANAAGGGKSGISDQTKRTNSSNAQTFSLPASAEFVNVMGNEMPKMPAFPNVAKKPGKVRGYVKDLSGKPLEGAYIGIRSSMVGGYYSGADSETDANGFYEIEVPRGAAHFYAAGYTIDYGEGRAAVALHPADGKAESFASAAGAVENFVLLPYGIADRDEASEKPWFSSSYYGGAIRIEYDINSGDMWASKGSLPAGAEIEITLTPDGEMLGGGAQKSFVIRRPTGGNNNFNINNIPVGSYQISAKLTSGKALKMKKTGYGSTPLFGLNPGEAIGSAKILFTPNGAKTLSAQPNRGNWNAAAVKLELP